MDTSKRKIGHLLTLFVFLLANYLAEAQQTVLPFVNYNSVQGLTHNRIHVIRQDGCGYIWIGTDMGINRFDGREFKYFAPPEPRYRSSRYATVYKDSVIFCVDNYGIAVCGGNSVRFVKLGVPKVGSMSGVAKANDSTLYVVDRPGGLYEMKGQHTTKIIVPGTARENNLTDVFADKDKNIWALTSVGLIVYPHSNMQNPIEVPFFNNHYLTSINQDRLGVIYVTSDLGMHRYNGGGLADVRNTKPELMFLPPSGTLTSIAFDEKDIAWISSTSGGLYRFDTRTKEIADYGIPNGLISQNTWNVCCDKESNIWVATETGISKLTTRNYSNVSFANHQYQNIKAACNWDDSTLLFSNILEMFAHRGNNVVKFSGYNSNPGYLQQIFLKTPDGRLIVNREAQLDPGDFDVTTYVYDVAGNSIRNGKVVVDKAGGKRHIYIESGVYYAQNDMIVNTDKGLMVYRGGVLYPTIAFSNGHESARAMRMTGDSHGALWIMENNGTLVRYAVRRTGAEYLLDEEQTIHASKFSNTNYSYIFFDSQDRLWLCGKDQGMSIVYPNSGTSNARVVNLGRNAFSSGIINDIVSDDQKNLWVATAQGLDKVVFEKDSFTVLKDLYGSELCGKYIFFVKFQSGKLFVGTTGCMGTIDIGQPEPMMRSTVYLTGLKVNNNDADSLLGTHPVFQPNENILSFVFTGINFKDEKRIKYSYRLEGLDSNWSVPSREFSVSFLHVAPGTYTFRVRALSADGLWPGNDATFTFTVAQPFYTRFWFIGLCVILGSAIVYAVYRYRIRQLMAIQNIRQAISKDLHDDIGATISSINILAGMAQSELASESKRGQFLETIQEESRHVGESLKDIVWSIDPRNDSFAIIFVRMQRYASELFEAKNINYSFNTPATDGHGNSIDMRARQHIYLLFKEAVNNLVKYSGATEASITFEISKKKFEMVIEDNGVGFDTSKPATGNGLMNMKKRATDINAKLTIKSSPGKGTRVSMLLEL